MKISCTKENLAGALALVSGITSKNVNLPILNNVLIRVDQQKVELVSTNLELAVVVVVRAKIEDVGSFTVPARTLADFVNLLPNEKIDLELKDTELVVRCGKSSTKIKGTSPEDYPIIPTLEDGKGYTLIAEDLKTSISQVLPSVAKNDIRPELAGICFGFNVGGEKGLVLASTDSYRLAEKKLTLQQGADELRVVVPGRTAQELVHALTVADAEEKTVRLVLSENQLVATYGSVQIISRLVENQYPDYTQIIPKEFSNTTEVDRNKLVKEMKASGLFTATGVNAVTITLKPKDNVLSVASTSTQTGEYSSEIEATVEGEEKVVLLNNRYVLEGLNNMDGDTVKLEVVNSDAPCVFRSVGDPNFLYIVMPIRQ